MAFTRKMLKALGIEDEKVDQIMDAHTEVTDALKADRDKYKVDADKLDGVQKELDTLKAKGDDGYKEKYEAEKSAHDKLKTDIANEKAYAAKETAYRELLKSSGVKEKFIDTIIRADKSVVDGLKIGEDGKIADEADIAKNAKTNWSDFIATTSTRTAGVESPPVSGVGKMTNADIFKKDEHGRYVLSAAERQKAIADNLNNERN